MLEWICCIASELLALEWYVILGVIAAITGILGFSIFGILRGMVNFIKNKSIKTQSQFINNEFIWIPQQPLTNDNITHIDKHPWSHRLDIVNGRITGNMNEPETMATREDALKQAMLHYVLTPRGRYMIYPIDAGAEEAETIFIVDDKVEFQRQAANLAEGIMGEFSDWIQKLYSISRENDALIIEFKVKGISTSLKCMIPNIENEVIERQSPIAKQYIVKENDTLATITHHHGRCSSDWRELYNLNREILHEKSRSGQPIPGQQLEIPDKWLREWYSVNKESDNNNSNENQ